MKLEFTIEQMQILDRALQALPYGVVAPLIHSINQQLQAEEKAKAAECVTHSDYDFESKRE